jgi:hypothetical protein
MAKNLVPIFGKTAALGGVTISAANTARDGSGAIVTLVAGVSDGRRIDRITFLNSQATAGANAATVCRVWISTDTGSTWKLYDEVALGAVTASNTAVGARAQLTYARGIILESSAYIIGVTTAVRGSASDNIDVVYEGEDFAG